MADGHGNGLAGIAAELDLKNGRVAFHDIQRVCIRYNLIGGRCTVIVDFGCCHSSRAEMLAE